ncbi:hypothetical protein Tco_0510603 [Tanacetum coccineum]
MESYVDNALVESCGKGVLIPVIIAPREFRLSLIGTCKSKPLDDAPYKKLAKFAQQLFVFVHANNVDAMNTMESVIIKEEEKRNAGRKYRSKAGKIDIGRFPFAMMMTMTDTIAITPVLPTKEPVNSLVTDSYENIDYVDASPPDDEIVSLEVVEIVIPEVGGIDTDVLLTIKDDILREKLLNVNLLIANIEALKDNPAPSSDNSSGSTTTHSDYSLPDYEVFYSDNDHIEEKSSGSPTTHSDLSLPDYKAFYVDNDHFKERSSGSTPTHVDFSQYDPFIFDLSNDQFPPADRSDFNHEEFADELTHIMPLPELKCFKFKIEPDPGNLTSVDPGILSPPYLLSTGNEDTIFDPGISIYHSFMPDVSHRSGTFMKFNVYPNRLNERFLECADFVASSIPRVPPPSASVLGNPVSQNLNNRLTFYLLGTLHKRLRFAEGTPLNIETLFMFERGLGTDNKDKTKTTKPKRQNQDSGMEKTVKTSQSTPKKSINSKKSTEKSRWSK